MHLAAARQSDDVRIADQRHEHRGRDEQWPQLELSRASEHTRKSRERQHEEAELDQWQPAHRELGEKEKTDTEACEHVRPRTERLGKRAHRYLAVWIGLPVATSAASRNVSASVGCAWIVAVTSSTVASRRMARVASAISSDACGPAMCTPTMRWSLPAVTIFVVPAVS